MCHIASKIAIHGMNSVTIIEFQAEVTIVASN